MQADIVESSVLALAKEDYESMKLCLEKSQNNKLLLQVKLKQSAAFDEELKKLEEEVRKLWVIGVDGKYALSLHNIFIEYLWEAVCYLSIELSNTYATF